MEFVLLPLAIVVLFYLILLRPLLKAQKRRGRHIAMLRVGDEVLTSGGFYAIVRRIESREDGPPTIFFEFAPGAEVEGTADAIESVNPRGEPLTNGGPGRPGDPAE